MINLSSPELSAQKSPGFGSAARGSQAGSPGSDPAPAGRTTGPRRLEFLDGLPTEGPQSQPYSQPPSTPDPGGSIGPGVAGRARAGVVDLVTPKVVLVGSRGALSVGGGGAVGRARGAVSPGEDCIDLTQD